MGYCTNCGNELKDGTLFCPKCGKPVFFKESNRDSSEDSPSYSIELLSFESDMRHQLTKVLTDLLRIELMDAVKIIDSAPCSIATGLSLMRAEEFAKRIEDAGAVIAMKKNGGLIHKTESEQQHLDEKEEEPGCLSLILFFLIPIAGFFVFASNWRDKPKKADMALFYGLLGMTFSIIFSIIHLSVYWEGYCRLAQIITGKF